MKMKKVLAILLSVAVLATVCVCLVACGGNGEEEMKPIAREEIKIGLICLHDANSTYDKNFIDAMDVAKKELGLRDDQVIVVTGVPEGDECYQKACNLADEGCDIIFADSFGHEPYMIKAAKEYPNVQFCHATGTKAHTEKLANYHNAFASIYEGRYLAGIAAGMKLNEMIAAGKFTAEEAKIGYVGAYPYAEVKSGYTSFFLGARSVCPTATMEVTFTGEWYHETKENNAATNLINRGCKLISQHADSMGAPNACEAAGIPNVSYNGSTIAHCPKTFIVSSRINWAPYYQFAIENVIKGEKFGYDWTGTLATGSVVLTDINEKVAAAGTKAAIEEAKAKLEDGTLKVFDTSKFTVNGKKLTTFLADVDDFNDYEGETEVVINGIFEESAKRSAPYFTLDIDGITNIDAEKKN